MAPDATVLVALRRQSSFLHRSSFRRRRGLLARDVLTPPPHRRAPTRHLARAGWSGTAAFFAAFGT
eukprot:6685043-Prymnesium_polylepis.1